jgi:2-polyprenyl-6-methoxyphenol hydroxylase-like FAD-dependent oxidoreductase
MHPQNCNCPSCRHAAQAFGFEAFQHTMPQAALTESEELELAHQLLNVRSDQEWEQFLGDVFKSIGKGLKAVGSFAAKNVLPVVGGALKQIAKTALPLAGGALGSLIPIPGVGTALGSALGGAVAKALEMEVGQVDPAHAELERARRFVRLTGDVMQEVATASPSTPPEAVVRTALVNAVTRHLPAAAHAMATAPGGENANLAPPHLDPRPMSGTWQRHGRYVVIQGL